MAKQSLLELKQLVWVAKSASFSAAARELGLTPAAVSATVARFERELNVRLFERSTRNLRVTEDGARFLQHCQQALDILDFGVSELQSQRYQLSGKVVLSVPSDIVRTFLQDCLLAFSDRHPEVELDLRVADSLANLLSEPVDLAIRYSSPKDSGLVARTLQDCKRVACASPGYLAQSAPIRHPDDLKEHDCLCFQLNGQIDNQWRFVKDNKTFKVQVAGKMSTNDSALARAWAVAGKGVVYKSELDLAEDIRSGLLQPVLTDFEGQDSPLYLVYTGRKNLPLRVRAIMDFLLEQFSSAVPAK